MRLKTIVKNSDMFGWQIKLRFDKKGDTHKTLFGGIVSVCVYVMMLAYASNLLVKMFQYGDDKNSSVSYNKKLNFLEDRVLYKDLESLLYFFILDNHKGRVLDP